MSTENVSKEQKGNDANRLLAVRCINPKNTGLKTDKIYTVTECKNFDNCYILDVGWNWILSKDIFEVVQQ